MDIVWAGPGRNRRWRLHVQGTDQIDYRILSRRDLLTLRASGSRTRQAHRTIISTRFLIPHRNLTVPSLPISCATRSLNREVTEPQPLKYARPSEVRAAIPDGCRRHSLNHLGASDLSVLQM